VKSKRRPPRPVLRERAGVRAFILNHPILAGSDGTCHEYSNEASGPDSRLAIGRSKLPHVLYTPPMTIVRKPPSLPPRPSDGHKGLFGRVLVVGGCSHMLGAPVLAATAALRSGAGLVQIALPAEMLPAALSITPELIGLPLSAKPDLPGLLAAARQADALIIGPGMGQSPVAQTRLLELLTLDLPAVLDADALNMLAGAGEWPVTRLRAVLTPHPGEMARLTQLLGSPLPSIPEEKRRAIALAAARKFGQVVLLKGHRTLVTDSVRLYTNHTGDSTLSKAGSGDVLAGIIGCFLAQGMAPFDAACLGAHLHGLCGELAGREMTQRCPLARDLISQLPAAFRQCGSP
jgi:ADP-dependent NAD(P)H-hydrate dehydratase